MMIMKEYFSPIQKYIMSENSSSNDLLGWLEISYDSKDVPVKLEGSTKNIERRSRNRVAAKESRRRKKAYIAELEHSIEDLQSNINEVNREITDCFHEIGKKQYVTIHGNNELDSKLQHVFAKLSRICMGEKEDEEENVNELNLCIDSICYRLGALGKERKGQMDQSYKHMVNLSVPSLHRYLFWSAFSDTHLFGNEQVDSEWFKCISILINFKALNKKFLSRKKEELKQGRKQMLKHIQRLEIIKSSFQKQGADLDNLFLDVREMLSPIQAGRFILFIEKYKQKSQLRYHQRIWSQVSYQRRPSMQIE